MSNDPYTVINYFLRFLFFVGLSVFSSLAIANDGENENQTNLPNKDSEVSEGTVRNYREELNLMGYYHLDLNALDVKELSTDKTFRLKSGSRFSFVKFDKDANEYWIKIDCTYTPFVRGVCLAGNNLEGTGEEVSDGSIYKVSPKILQDGTYTLSRVLDHGILLVPFKYRTDDGSLTGQSTIGYYAGFRSDTVLFSGTTFLSAGLSVVPIANDDGEQSNTTAFSLGAGYTFATKSNFQVSIVAGFDHVGGSAGDAWQYEDDPWVSIAFGYNFLQRF